MKPIKLKKLKLILRQRCLYESKLSAKAFRIFDIIGSVGRVYISHTREKRIHK